MQMTMRLLHASQGLYTSAQEVLNPYRQVMTTSMNDMDNVLVEIERDLLPAASMPRQPIPGDNFPTRRHLPGSAGVPGMPPLEPIASDTSLDVVSDDPDASAQS